MTTTTLVPPVANVRPRGSVGDALRRYTAAALGIGGYFWATLVVVAAGVVYSNSRTVGVTESIVASGSNAPRFFALAMGITLVVTYLTPHVASGRTRASLVGTVTGALGVLGVVSAVILTVGFQVERTVYEANGWPIGIRTGHTFTSTDQVGPVLVENLLVIIVFGLAGLLIGTGYRVWGGARASFALPLTALPALLALAVLELRATSDLGARWGVQGLSAPATYAVLALLAAATYGVAARVVRVAPLAPVWPSTPDEHGFVHEAPTMPWSRRTSVSARTQDRSPVTPAAVPAPARPSGWPTATFRLVGGTLVWTGLWVAAILTFVVALVPWILAYNDVDPFSLLSTAGVAPRWFLFVMGIVLVPACFATHVATGQTRRSFATALTAALVGVSLAAAVVVTLGFAVEHWAHTRLGWSGELLNAHLFTSGDQMGPVLLENALLVPAYAVSGMLVGATYYSFGGWRGTALLPLTVGPVLDVNGFLVLDGIGGVWRVAGFDSAPLPVRVAAVVVVVALMVAATYAALRRAHVRRLPI